MAVVQDILFALACFVALATMALVGYMVGRQKRPAATRIVVAAKTVENRTMANYSRAQRRAHKRRRR